MKYRTAAEFHLSTDVDGITPDIPFDPTWWQICKKVFHLLLEIAQRSDVMTDFSDLISCFFTRGITKDLGHMS